MSIFLLCLLFTSFAEAQQRIVSLSGTISEMLCALGFESQIAGVDVTSTYPLSLKQKPKVGHNRNISAEGILALRPTLVLGLKEQTNPQLLTQLKSAGVKTVMFEQELSPDGVKVLLNGVALAVGAPAKAKAVQSVFEQQMKGLKIQPVNKKVLFIYARGTGTMMVSGTGTSIEKMISLAGAKNAVTDFQDFKPLTAEALVAADPDAILLFDSGLKSLNGPEGLLKVPGVAQTTAGRNRKIVSMDGELLSGFSLRLPAAIKDLHNKIL